MPVGERMLVKELTTTGENALKKMGMKDSRKQKKRGQKKEC